MRPRPAIFLSLSMFLGSVSVVFADKPEPPARFDGQRVVEVTLATPADIDTMLAISGDFWACVLAPGDNLFTVAPEALPELEASGLPYRIISENLQEMIDESMRANALRGPGWFDNFHNLTEINAFMDSLVAARPDLATKFPVGSSLEGRTIFGLRVTGPGDPSGRPGVLYNACQHAREWVSPPVPMYVADQMITGYGVDAHLTYLMDHVVFYLVPVVNVDGYEYSWTTNRMWRKNRRNNGDGTFGVDTNRNWGYEWGGSGASPDPSSETYRGPAPFSEPETQAMRDFIIAHPDIAAQIDFHSFSQLVMSPWGYSTGEPPNPDGQTFRDLNAAMAAAIFSVYETVYVHGPIGATLYLASGNAVDWSYGDRGIMTWTIELRPASNPPGFLIGPEEILPTCEENFEAILVLTDWVTALLGFSYPAGLPETVAPDVPASVTVQIDDLRATYQAGTAQIHYRLNGGAYSSAPLASQGANQFVGSLPGAACGAQIDFYFSAQTTGGETVTDPRVAPAEVFSTTAAAVTAYASDEMESDAGWTVGAPGDNATTGIWNRMNPQGTAAQPEDDHTPAGVNCWVTDGNSGGSLGANDVDGGRTTLISPAYDVSGSIDPTVSYWRWYSNTAGGSPNADVFVVDITADGATWVNVETVGPAGPETGGGWFEHAFRLRDFVEPSATVQLRFIAADEGSGSIVEAAIDDLDIVDAGCPGGNCPGDIDGDGDRDLGDLSIVLANFGTASGATPEQGDLNGDGAVDLTDLSVMLSVFGEACAP